MANEPEMIRQQMDDTRTALTDKLEVLEQQVKDTVQGASSAVTETVGSVQDMVQDTVQTVKDSMHETVESVKDTLNIKNQVDRRPWTMLAGATALGFLGGYLLPGRGSGQARGSSRGASSAPAVRAQPAWARNGMPAEQHAVADERTNGRDAAANSAPDEPGWIANLGDTFQAEISQLKGLAIGTLLGIVRDIVVESVSEPLERQVEEVINGITVKLGGQLIRDRILPERSESESAEKTSPQEDHGYRSPNAPRDFPSRLPNRA